MRDVLTFHCEGESLAATLDSGTSDTGLLIVSGGNEIRIGAHRGMAKLAAEVARHGNPVFRFDRRGIGDSSGENHGFLSSGPDIAAAAAAFRKASPFLQRIVGFGNCDAATALMLNGRLVDAVVLANPWVIEPVDDLPPAPAIRDRYARRIRDPEAWAALLTGKVDLRAVAKGLGRIAMPRKAAQPLEAQAAAALAAADDRIVPILLAKGDNTAIAFADAWKRPGFDAARWRVRIVERETSSHSFSGEGDFEWLMENLRAVLGW